MVDAGGFEAFFHEFGYESFYRLYCYGVTSIDFFANEVNLLNVSP